MKITLLLKGKSKKLVWESNPKELGAYKDPVWRLTGSWLHIAYGGYHEVWPADRVKKLIIDNNLPEKA